MKKIKMLLVPILSAVFCFCFALAFLPVAARAENKSGSYFMTGTDTEQTFVYGTVGGEMGSFTPDGGGSVAGRKLNAGEEITYKFSIDEAITSTDLKLYGNFGGGAANGGVTVKWSVDGETFETLATASQTAVYKTGVYKFSLTEDDALSGNNTFYIRLTATADIYVSSVYAGTDYGISADATSVTLVPGSEAAMKHYVVAKNFESAYGGTPWLFVLNGGEITYRFALPETWKNAVLSYGADSSVTVKYSDSDGNVISAEGASNTIDLQSGIAKNTTGVFDITFGATAGNAIFTSPITLTKADSNEVIFLAGDDAEKEHLVSLTNENLTSLAGDNSQSAAVAHALDKDDYIIYKFRMPASMTAGQLRLFGRLARDTGNSVTVDYSFDGESWASLTVGGAIYNTGIYRCALNEENVFAEGNKEFYIRVTAVQDGLALYGVYVGTGASIVKDETTVINAMTENHLRYLSANNLEFIFFNSGVPTLEILNGGSMTYYFDLPDNWANAKIAFNVLQGSIDMKYVAEGVEAVISSGADLEKYLKDNNGNTFYIVLGATGNCLFDNLTVTKAEPTGNYDEPEEPEIVPGKGDNLNETVPADSEEVYFNVNTEAENAYKYYNENAAFDSTHSGIGVNDANGSWNASANNARVLRAGEYLVYDFDMADEATTARLVIYGSKALKVSVSTDNGENWTDIQTTVSPYQLGYNVYLLTEENALAGENNAFRLKIECSSTCYVNEIYVATKEVAVEGSVRLVTHSIEMMRYFYAGSDNYTYVSYNKTPFIFLVGKDKFVTFRFPIAEGTEVKSILSTLIANPNQNVSLYVSADDEDYQYLYTATTGGGTPPVKQFDVPEELAEAGVLYVKAVSEAG
ncbi:MAG: hypothetical protein IJR61_00950, partial [Clostridia bacterium]|nr:hypothetical protein [Clostridia bacterium]